ncbi:MAG: AMP-binding protein [Selenomonadaceae bacterium]|nr:AMP-binding protein [Selenomonadaceae bacterium]
MLFNLEKYNNSAALITKNEVWSYKKLLDISKEIERVIEKRSLVFILTSNHPASVAFYIACLNNDIVPAMIDTELDEALLVKLIKIYNPQYLWVPKNLTDSFSSYKEVLNINDYFLLNTGNPHYLLNEDLALLVTTSGSTGSPKFVRLSYENLLSNTNSIIQYLDINEKERSITNLPMNYVYGLSIINTHLYAGASLVVTDTTLFQKEFWQLFKEYEVTNFGGVPYTFAMLEKMRFFRMKLPHLKTITQAGGKLNPELHRKFAEYAQKENKRFFVMYGASEATARMGYLPFERSLEKCGSMGIAIPGGSFSLVDESGNAIDDIEKVGELVYRGKNVMMGYAQTASDLKNGDETGGCLYTGDIAKRDVDGFYTIVGRKSRFLKMFGKRTNLEEIEFILKEHFKVEFACGGIDNKLYVFVTDHAIEKTISPYLSEKLKLHPSAIKPIFIESIPKSSSGKILYSSLKNYYEEV